MNSLVSPSCSRSSFIVAIVSSNSALEIETALDYDVCIDFGDEVSNI